MIEFQVRPDIVAAYAGDGKPILAINGQPQATVQSFKSNIQHVRVYIVVAMFDAPRRVIGGLNRRTYP